jgi:hypothetical protein
VIAAIRTDLLETCIAVKKSGKARAAFALYRVVVVGDTCVSEEGMAAIVGRNKRYYVCGGAHGFYGAPDLALQISDTLPRSAAGIR